MGKNIFINDDIQFATRIINDHSIWIDEKNIYTEIFDQENSLNNLEKFTSINGAKFYNLEVNKDKIKLLREKWKINQYTEYNNIKVKNFYGGNILNWRIEN